MKVVLEFTDEERTQAEYAFYGADYRAALYRTKWILLNTLKYGELTKAQRATVMDIQKQFTELTSDLPLD